MQHVAAREPLDMIVVGMAAETNNTFLTEAIVDYKMSGIVGVK